ncbi:MAG: hypothetical protein O3A85_09990 [Proteobacteria bacterium]|nr:hypothetical protein [Pseudomonadota bacterium]
MSETLSFAPMVPLPLIAVLAVVGLVLAGIALARGAPGGLLRIAVLAVLVVALVNPRALREERQPQRDVALVAVDRSASQEVGGRRAETDAALKSVREGLARFKDLDVRIIEATDDTADKGATTDAEKDGGTRLFSALARAAAEVPRQRLAGAIMITDGQIHDIPAVTAAGKLDQKAPSPLHVLLTGKSGESDRRLVIEQAPSYGIVGKSVTIRYRVEDQLGDQTKSLTKGLARMRLRYDDDKEIVSNIPVGRSSEISFELEHAGPTVVEMSVAAAPGELSTINNRALVSINGVRDRLRVLLVSGQPHAGERAWRNLLKSDPSVDLVHFTILRPPEKDDFTPLRELALIAFPIQELFELKLAEFDLIVFDRYVVRDVLPPSYITNIVNFVKEGGALLLALGPEFATPRSLFQTPMGQIMPASPTGRVLEQGFKPTLTDIGRRHPVTAGLPMDGDKTPEWGRWFRMIEAVPRTGRELMRGVDGKPLLMLERNGKGRVAQVLSDHIWLWARGYEGGGPQAELLRRLAHWLMKEPDLDEEALKAEIKDGRLQVQHRSLDAEAPPDVTVTKPSGQTQPLRLEDAGNGVWKGAMAATASGLYKVTDGTQTALATLGALNPLEFHDLRASAEKIRPVAEASGGGIHWINKGLPDFRRTRPGRDSHGDGWVGLVANHSFVVSGLAQVSLLPGYLVMILVLGALMAAWYREGH